MASPRKTFKFRNTVNNNGISAIFHYVPLHKAPYWDGKYNQIHLPVTEKVGETLLRLPMYYGLKKEQIEYIVNKIIIFFKNKKMENF